MLHFIQTKLRRICDNLWFGNKLFIFSKQGDISNKINDNKDGTQKSTHFCTEVELYNTTNILVRVFNIECRLFKVFFCLFALLLLLFFLFAQHNVNSDFLSFLVVIYFYSVYVLEMINVSRTACYELLNVQLS